MAGVSFRMTLTRRGKSFKQIDQAMYAAMTNVQFTNAVDLLDTARRRAPERTGRLKREMRVQRTGPLAYVVEAPTPYASFQEEGTRTVPGKHFLRQAVAEVEPRAEARTAAALRREAS